jgi:hypothetical protein
VEPDGVEKGEPAKLMEEVEFRGTVNSTCVDIDPNISQKLSSSRFPSPLPCTVSASCTFRIRSCEPRAETMAKYDGKTGAQHDNCKLYRDGHVERKFARAWWIMSCLRVPPGPILTERFFSEGSMVPRSLFSKDGGISLISKVSSIWRLVADSR